MAWVIGSVTLPYGPVKVVIGSPPKVSEFELDGDEPILIVEAPGPLMLTLTGSITAVDAKDDVWDAYIAPLLAMKGTSQSISDPSGVYDGTYLVADFAPEDVSQGSVTRFTYKLVLKQGTGILTL